MKHDDHNQRNISTNTSKWFIYCSHTDPDYKDQSLFRQKLYACWLAVCIHVCKLNFRQFQIQCGCVCADGMCNSDLFMWCSHERPLSAYTPKKKKYIGRINNIRKKNQFNFHAYICRHKRPAEKFQPIHRIGLQHICDLVCLQPIHR